MELADLTTYYNSHKTYQYIRTVTLLPLYYNHYITTIIFDYHITTTFPCVPWVGRWQAVPVFCRGEEEAFVVEMESFVTKIVYIVDSVVGFCQ